MPGPAIYTLITGASSGIGREVAVQLSQDRRLILHGRNAERLEETRDRCVKPTDHVIALLAPGCIGSPG
jgi:short-subunit dehydrogenase